MHPKFTKPLRSQQAFTLLELSISVLLISIMIASILPAITQQIIQDNMVELGAKQKKIKEALSAFRIANNRLPCPAQAGLDINNTNFGVEAANNGTCISGTPAATQDSGTKAAWGLLPVRTLGLQDDIAFDPWGRAYSYMVDLSYTETSAFTSYAINNTSAGEITVTSRDHTDDSATTILSNAIAVIVSSGPNGHGGYLPSGSRYNADSSNGDEHDNCNCSATAVSGTVDRNFFSAMRKTSDTSGFGGYDDITYYYSRFSFVTDDEIK